MTNQLDKKEIEKYQGQIELAENFSTILVIKDDNDYQSALSEGKIIKERLELLVGRKEEITKPLNATLKSVRDLFRPREERFEAALKIIKTKMLAYTAKKEAVNEEKKAKIDERVENGTLRESTGEVKKWIIDNNLPKTVSSDIGSATTKKVKKYYVVDKSLIPLQFMEVDMVKVRASFKAGSPVSGIEERIENELSIS